MTDAEMTQAIRNHATDLDLSANFEQADKWREIAARFMELTSIHAPISADLEAKWEKAWNDSLHEAVKTVVQTEIDAACVRAADILRGQ